MNPIISISVGIVHLAHLSEVDLLLSSGHPNLSPLTLQEST